VISASDLRDEEWVAVHEGFPLEQAIRVIATISGQEARIPHRINEFLVAATVVAAGNCIALLPRHTTGVRGHPEVVLRPLDLPGLGRHIDCLARPETLERADVRTVLDRLRDIAADLLAPDRPSSA
jgi:DNA-binding transcriptional LysR family regulator